MPTGAVWAAFFLLTPSADDVAVALERVEPPPGLRASFEATVSSGGAYRTIRYDPFVLTGSKFTVTRKMGSNEELDAIVAGWRAEGQADARLFADDLRLSLGEARWAQRGNDWAVEFRHRISPNDGPVDAVVSSRMVGELSLTPTNDQLRRVDYRIVKPIKLEGGARLTEYQQTFQFGYSGRWNVSYIGQYDLHAKGGRWGFNDSRHIQVKINKVTFRMASDARQELASR